MILVSFIPVNFPAISKHSSASDCFLILSRSLIDNLQWPESEIYVLYYNALLYHPMKQNKIQCTDVSFLL